MRLAKIVIDFLESKCYLGGVRKMPASAIDRSHDNGQRTCCSIFSSSSGRVRGRFAFCASIVGDSDNFLWCFTTIVVYTEGVHLHQNNRLHNHYNLTTIKYRVLLGQTKVPIQNT